MDVFTEEDFPEIAKKFCPECGKKIPSNLGRPRSFCSDACRRAWWKQHPDFANPNPSAIYTFRCRHCGQLFQAYGNQKRIYCSRGCYLQHRFPKRKES